MPELYLIYVLLEFKHTLFLNNNFKACIKHPSMCNHTHFSIDQSAGEYRGDVDDLSL